MKKKCSLCNQVKPINEFYRNSYNKDGHLQQCKECFKKKDLVKYKKTYKEKHLLKIRKRSSEWNKKKRKDNPELFKKKDKLRRDKKKHQIMNKVQRAVKSGKITRSKYCLCCGQEKELHGHHPDYSKPLEVIWLCPACHKFLHTNLKKFHTLFKGEN